jgi:hypothetical protein
MNAYRFLESFRKNKTARNSQNQLSLHVTVKSKKANRTNAAESERGPGDCRRR